MWQRGTEIIKNWKSIKGMQILKKKNICYMRARSLSPAYRVQRSQVPRGRLSYAWRQIIVFE